MKDYRTGHDAKEDAKNITKLLEEWGVMQAEVIRQKDRVAQYESEYRSAHCDLSNMEIKEEKLWERIVAAREVVSPSKRKFVAEKSTVGAEGDYG